MKIRPLRTREEYYYEQSCKGKKAHQTFEQAERAKVAMLRKYGVTLVSYECQNCRLYHNGSIKTVEKENKHWFRFLHK